MQQARKQTGSSTGGRAQTDGRRALAAKLGRTQRTCGSVSFSWGPKLVRGNSVTRSVTQPESHVLPAAVRGRGSSGTNCAAPES